MHSTYKKFALGLAKAGLFIVPFIPLYVSRSLFFPYITGKAFIFRLVVEAAFAAWIFLAIFYKEYRPRKSYLLLAIGIFVSVVTLATIFGVNPWRSFWSNFERMEGLLAHLHLFAYFLVLGHVFKRKDWLIFLNLFVIAGLGENIYALIQKLGYLPSPQGGFRVDGTIGNPTYLSAYLIFVAAFCLWLFLEAKNKSAKYFYAFVGLFSLLSIYFTATRGAAVALVAGGFLAVLLYLIFIKADTEQKRLHKKFAVVFLALLILIPAAIKLSADTSFVKNNEVLSRFASISFSEAKTRFTIWEMGWQGVKERPVLGWGPENYAVIFAKHYNPSLYSQEPWFDRSHNIVFDWLINAGILGLLSYLGVLLAAFYMIWKNYLKNIFSVELAILFSVLLSVYVLQNMFVFDQLATYLSYFAVLAYIHNAATMQKRAELEGAAGADVQKFGPLVAAGLLALLVLVAYFVNFRPYAANRNLLDALKLQNQDLPGAFESYKKAMSYDTLGRQEAREQFARFAVAIGSLPQVGAELKDEALRRAITEAEKGVAENELDPRPYIFLGSVYSRVGLLDPAAQVLNKALELSPKKQQIYFELADVYIKKEDYATAVSILERAFNFAPRFDLARMNLAAAYILNGQQEKADQLLIEAYGRTDVTESVLVQVYSARKDYQRLAGIWGAFVESDPANTQYIKGLTGAYLLLGDEASAIKTLEEGASANPAFAPEASAFIRQIRSGNY